MFRPEVAQSMELLSAHHSAASVLYKILFTEVLVADGGNSTMVAVVFDNYLTQSSFFEYCYLMVGCFLFLFVLFCLTIN